jgi:UDP-glucuronate 4-epimerase
MRALVTGAAGFIGSHLCDRLLAEGEDVVGIDCFTDYYDRGLKELNLDSARSDRRFELRESDLLTADLGDLLEGIDAVFHLAAQPGVRGSWGARFDVYARNNILVTQRLLETLVASVRPIPFLYASSSSIYGSTPVLPTTEESPANPISPYGVTKLAGEHLASLYQSGRGIPVTVVRYFTVYGPRQRPDMAFTRFIRSVLTNDSVEVLGSGDQTRDFTFVSDAVDATVRAIAAPAGSCFNIGGGTRASINEALGLFGELLGRPVSVRRTERAAGDMQDTWADTTRARDELGWRPSTDLAEGLRQQIDWLSALIQRGA